MASMSLLHGLVVALPALGALSMLFLCAYAFSGRATPGRRPFGVLAALVGLWCTVAALEYLATDFSVKYELGRLVYLGAAPAPVAWLVFAARYTRIDRFLKATTIGVLCLLPAVTILLALTNEQHHWVWQSVTFAEEPLPDLVIRHGWWFRRVHVPYSYALFLAGLALLMSRFFSDFSAYRAQLTGVIFSACMVFVANLAYTQGGITVYGLDPSPLLAAVFTIGVGISLFRGFLALQPLSYRAVFMATDDAVFLIDAQGQIVDLNPAARLLVAHRRPLGSDLEAVIPWLGSDEQIRHDGRTYSVKRVRLSDGKGRPEGEALLLRDMTPEFAQQQLLKARAQQDSLTQALNRGAFDARLRERLDGRRSEWPQALLFLDLDNFKRINDRHGHAAGDEALREAARRVQAALRPGDLLARIGGDEFAVLLDRADEAAVRSLAERLEAVLGEPYRVNERELTMGASVGWAVYPDDGADAAALLDAADRRMYAVKRERRKARQPGAGP